MIAKKIAPVFASLMLISASAQKVAEKAGQVELIFSHKLHCEDAGAECSACHASADTSSLSGHNLLPAMHACYECHDSADTECGMCHKDQKNAVPYPRITEYIAHFPHKAHREGKKKLTCEKCHAGAGTSENIMDTHLPEMDECTKCHTGVLQASYCYICHSRKEDLRPEGHKLDCRKHHGVAADLKISDCGSCHSDNMCLECHQKENISRRAHPLNFVNNHALWARGNKTNCYACHEELDHCANCHRQRMVMPRSHASAGWSNTTTGGAHARAAQLDLDYCVSCHSDAAAQPVCAQCHKDN
jgi:hypothetical protein